MNTLRSRFSPRLPSWLAWPGLRLDPLLQKKLRRFRAIPRGYYSLLALVGFTALALLAEVLVSNRALAVRYQGQWFFPSYGGIHTGRDFGLDYDYEVNYRDLQARWRTAPPQAGDGVWLPLVPYSPLENCYPGETFRPRPPDWRKGHWLGTDQINRDILARLLYGFRSALLFSAGFLVLTFAIGIVLGCLMGYLGGWVDLLGQRLIEIWTNIPFLFVVIIIASMVPPTLPILLGVVVLFSWTGITSFVRTATYGEKAREYVQAAQVLGAGTGRVIVHHLLPNLLSTLVTFIPFTVVGAIGALTSLDFLGFGLPPPTPSWGELLRQGTSNLDAPWIVASVFTALTVVLSLVTFVGEAIREAFDPKQHTFYE